MMKGSVLPFLLTPLLASMAGGCEPEPKDCIDGYARDNEGRCQVIVLEDTGMGAPGNTAPTAPAVSLSPVSPREQGGPLVCQITTESIDIDGDPISYTIEWTVNGTEVTAGDAPLSLKGKVLYQILYESSAHFGGMVTP